MTTRRQDDRRLPDTPLDCGHRFLVVPSSCRPGVLRTPASFEIRWKNTTGLDPEADTDDDGLTDWAETFVWGTDPNHADTDGDGTADNVEMMMGADPFDADEDGDGVPDGTDEEEWLAHPLWTSNATNTAHAITITLNSAVPAGASASFMVGSLCIPLRSPGAWSLGLVPGELYPYRLNVGGGIDVSLSIHPGDAAPPLRHSGESGAETPLWDEGEGGVFDEGSSGGSGELAIPTLELQWIDSGDGSHESTAGVCLHNCTEARFLWSLRPLELAVKVGSLSLVNFCAEHRELTLAVSGTGDIVSGIASLPEGSLRFGHLGAVAYAHFCNADYWSPYCPVCGIHQFLYEAWHDIDYLTVVPSGMPGGREIVHFPGSVTRTFDPTSSPVPDLHQPLFYEDVRDSLLMQDHFYDYVNTDATMTPDDEPPASAAFEWRCIAGRSDLLPENGFETWASFLLRLEGGVYHFRFRNGSAPPGDAILVLPLAGASIDSIVTNEIAHADVFAAKVNSKYVWIEKNSPENGIKWFWANGAGDFLGRPDNASSPTVWYYNQVNDDSGRGAVCTWNGRCMRIAKLSDFLYGYACEKLGVSLALQDMSQGSGTWNDASATSSWLAGVFFAEGMITLDGCAELIAEASWSDSGGEKVRKLWPNLAPADNFVTPDCFWDPNTQFTAPGFLYMENP